jgi:hypothetical protein
MDIELKQTRILTYLRSWALLEEPPIVQPLKNFPAFYGTRMFNTVFTRTLRWSLSWAISIQSTPVHPISLRSILILSTHLRLGLPSGHYHSCYMPRSSHPSWLDYSNYTWRRVQVMKLLITMYGITYTLMLPSNATIYFSHKLHNMFRL